MLVQSRSSSSRVVAMAGGRTRQLFYLTCFSSSPVARPAARVSLNMGYPGFALSSRPFFLVAIITPMHKIVSCAEAVTPVQPLIQFSYSHGLRNFQPLLVRCGLEPTVIRLLLFLSRAF